jgi:hypothetical protein
MNPSEVRGRGEGCSVFPLPLFVQSSPPISHSRRRLQRWQASRGVVMVGNCVLSALNVLASGVRWSGQ